MCLSHRSVLDAESYAGWQVHSRKNVRLTPLARPALSDLVLVERVLYRETHKLLDDLAEAALSS